ncbi:Arsenite methyltransferase [Micractinium conductrix]|uniref:Arsenite methyltransferase n=1 Tax=Micractinium conductrix TaxID=554055 RepID=A0A2P6V7G0_9CHLO|nr:Arsenite methyltransferase [Micractinium conductrix]|eukprot:PSC70020.1 Arsenite methyltransferase [Micractinium conductrix]
MHARLAAAGRSPPSPSFPARRLMSCCGPKAANGAAAAAPSGIQELLTARQLGEDAQAVRDSVKEYYGEVLTTSDDLKTSACCTTGAPPPLVRDALKKVPEEVKAKYYGCGSPFPMGIDGLRVLDLGSGSGRDCYVCSALVGQQGSVTGIDMTLAQLEVARKHADEYCTKTLGYASPNMRFVEGTIEDLAAAGIADASVDLIISNCVINLSPDKAAVLREAYRVLAPGGEMYFSDVYCDRRLPTEVRTHPVLLGECLGGALYIQDFIRLCGQVGFLDPRTLSSAEIEVRDKELKALLGEARFYSVTYRLFKLPDAIETLCEDYGQACKYKGTIPGHPHSYQLDDHHTFNVGKWYEVCGNSAAMVGDSWLGRHFEVVGDRSTHYGLFACGPAPTAAPADGAGAPGGACC